MVTIEKHHQLIPVQIRPYLIPFMMKEFSVKNEALFDGVEAKVVDISIHNSLGKIIRLLCEKAIKPIPDLERFSIFIRVKNSYPKKQWNAEMYKYSSGNYAFLHLPKEGVDVINNHFEGVFSQSLLFFLEGYSSSKDSEGLRAGVHLFMLKYNLYDFEIDPEALRRSYYRYQKEDKRLSFFCSKKSNRNIKCS